MSGTLMIVVVIAVFCLLVGPILMLKPTPRQRQLAAFRARGQSLGLGVSTASLEGTPHTVYTAPWPEERRARFGAAPWTLARKSYEHNIHMARWWHFVGPNRATPAQSTPVTALLERLPESVVGLGASSQGLAAYWLEKGRPEELDKLAEMLKTAAEELWPIVRESDPAAPSANADAGLKP